MNGGNNDKTSSSPRIARSIPNTRKASLHQVTLINSLRSTEENLEDRALEFSTPNSLNLGSPRLSNLTSLLNHPHSRATSPLPDSLVKQHLISPNDVALTAESPHSPASFGANAPFDNSYVSVSHSLLGGDTTSHIYKYADQQRESAELRRRNSEPDLQSLLSNSNPNINLAVEEDPASLRASDLRAPGMMRRAYLSSKAQRQGRRMPNHLTRNFIDFLVLYGFYGGDIVPSDDDDSDIDSDATPPDENTPLVNSNENNHRGNVNGTSAKKAFFMLLKAFVGTGVLFLPKAFAKGGMGFSIVLMLIIGSITLHCMLLLVETSREFNGLSFGEIGEKLYGPYMRQLVLVSITIAQIGFACAYYIFVAQNLRDFVMVISECRVILPDWVFILIQMAVYVPLAWVRKIKHFGTSSLIADVFIIVGLGYIFYYDISVLTTRGPSKEILWFNLESFPLFVGTALFSFEGICLILPIEQSMKKPERFGYVLTSCVVFIAILFVCVGAMGYLTFGDNVATVLFLNLPATNPYVSVIQFLYGLAIVLSFPITVHPAVRITEHAVFGHSTGKVSVAVKWKKNIFRFSFVAFLAAVAYYGSDNLDKFVSLVGCFACLPLMFIYPSLFHSNIAKSKWAKAKDYALVCFGLVALLYNTSVTISQMANGEKDTPIDRCSN